MPLSDAALQKKAKYDSQNFKIVSTHLPRDTAEAFREYCRANGTTAHALLKRFVEDCLKADASVD